MSRRDGGWAFCGCCGKQRTWTGDTDPGCDCPGEEQVVVRYEQGDFSIGAYRDAAGEPVSPYVVLDFAGPEEISMALASLRVATPKPVVVVGSRAEAMTLAALRAEDAASGYRGEDAIRDLLASVPKIEEARPMNRAQKRAKMRRGGR